MSDILKTEKKLKIMRANMVYDNVMYTMATINMNLVQ